TALRTKRSMQAKNAASVLPEPVGAQISVSVSARMCGQPCSCGSVGVPNFAANHSRTSGCAHERFVLLDSCEIERLMNYQRGISILYENVIVSHIDKATRRSSPVCQKTRNEVIRPNNR